VTSRSSQAALGDSGFKAALTGKLLPVAAARISPALSFLILIAWVALIRWPFRHYGNPDDGFFTEVALLWRQGVVPYVGVFDLKPPGFFAALALSQSIFGAGPAALHAIGVASDALTAALLFHLARRHGAVGVGVFSALLFPLLPQIVVRNDGYDFLIALTTLAMFLALSGLAPMRKAALAGLCIGGACIVKQTAAFEAVALFAILARDVEARGRHLQTMLAFAIAAAAAPLACVAYFASRGALGAMLTDVVSLALRRPGAASDGVSLLDGVGRLVKYSSDIGPVLAVATATALAQCRVAAPPAPIRALSLWFAFALLGVLAQHALLSCYLAPLLAPAVLLCGFGVAAVWPKDSTLARWAGVGAIGLAAVEVLVGFRLGGTRERVDLGSVDQVAVAIRAAGARAEDRLFVVNAVPDAVWIYSAAGVRPASPYLIQSQLLSNFPAVGPARIAEAMATRPRFVVVSAIPFRYGAEVAGARDIAEAALRQDYRRLARIGSGAEGYDLYEIAR
jgi:hypothetical protein